MKVAAHLNYVNLDAPYNAQYYKEGDIRTEIATMGCVEGTETIEYKINKDAIHENFESAFKRVNNLTGTVLKQGNSEYIDTSKMGITVKDTYTGKYVKVLKFIRNHNVSNWMELEFSNGQHLVATADHPLHVIDRGRTYVGDMNIGDKVVSTRTDKPSAISVVSIASKVEFNGRSSEYSYDVETESDRFDVSFIQSHNCRTRVIGNTYDPTKQVVTGRGNLSFTSINLPRLAIKASKGKPGTGDIAKFFESLEEMMELVHKQILERFEVQCRKHPRNFPFLMGQGVWLGSDKLGIDDSLREVLKHGTLSLGFIGLAETLVMLIGKHHGESEDAQKLGLKIIGYMRELCDRWSSEESMNYSLLATPQWGTRECKIA